MTKAKNDDHLICGQTALQIATLKQKHGNVFLTTVTDGNAKINAICKEPSMEVMEAVKTIGETSETQASIALYDNCVLHTDECVKHRFPVRMKIVLAISLKIAALQAETKNL